VANRQEFSALRWTTALPGCDHWRHDVKAVLTMAHDVFISYARADKPEAHAAATAPSVAPANIRLHLTVLLRGAAGGRR
jgi:hypothetical protein